MSTSFVGTTRLTHEPVLTEGLHRTVPLRCHDAITTASRFAVALGMQMVAKSDMTTGNSVYASYVLRSNDLVFVFSAPYGGGNEDETAEEVEQKRSNIPHSAYDGESMMKFITKHGLAVKVVGVVVDDARDAHRKSLANGARHATYGTGDGTKPPAEGISEVELYGDVVMRFVSESVAANGAFCLPRYEVVPVEPAGSEPLCYGLRRLDHAVGNVHDLLETVDYISNFTGMHEFAEFTAEDVGTVDSGLNSMVLANNSEYILLPVNEPTFGTKRKSQIQTYLEQNKGPGLQHLALKTDNIFDTVRKMRALGGFRGGFEFQKPASEGYYRDLPGRVGADALSPEQFKEVEELGLLVDKDDQGVLVQVFTKPLGDRPTVFIEIIQRIGCMREVGGEEAEEKKLEQAAGCGGFGKGNFSELFKSIENFERTLKMA